MRRWGLSCRRPVKRARKQDAVRVQRWKEEEYPAIAQRAQEEDAIIYWGKALIHAGLRDCRYEHSYQKPSEINGFRGLFFDSVAQFLNCRRPCAPFQIKDRMV